MSVLVNIGVLIMLILIFIRLNGIYDQMNAGFSPTVAIRGIVPVNIQSSVSVPVVSSGQCSGSNCVSF